MGLYNTLSEYVITTLNVLSTNPGKDQQCIFILNYFINCRNSDVVQEINPKHQAPLLLPITASYKQNVCYVERRDSKSYVRDTKAYVRDRVTNCTYDVVSRMYKMLNTKQRLSKLVIQHQIGLIDTRIHTNMYNGFGKGKTIEKTTKFTYVTYITI